MKRFLLFAVLLMSGLLTACEKSSDTESMSDKAADVAGEAMEKTGEKMQEAGDSMSETGESMQKPE